MVKPGVRAVAPGYVRGVRAIGTPSAFPELPQVDRSMGKAHAAPVNRKPHIARIRDPEAGNTATDRVLKVEHQRLVFIIAKYLIIWPEALAEELDSYAVGVVFPVARQIAGGSPISGLTTDER